MLSPVGHGDKACLATESQQRCQFYVGHRLLTTPACMFHHRTAQNTHDGARAIPMLEDGPAAVSFADPEGVETPHPAGRLPVLYVSSSCMRCPGFDAQCVHTVRSLVLLYCLTTIALHCRLFANRTLLVGHLATPSAAVRCSPSGRSGRDSSRSVTNTVMQALCFVW